MFTFAQLKDRVNLLWEVKKDDAGLYIRLSSLRAWFDKIWPYLEEDWYEEVKINEIWLERLRLKKLHLERLRLEKLHLERLRLEQFQYKFDEFIYSSNSLLLLSKKYILNKMPLLLVRLLNFSKIYFYMKHEIIFEKIKEYGCQLTKEGKVVDVSASWIISGYEQTIKNLANTYYPWSFFINEEDRLCSLPTIYEIVSGKIKEYGYQLTKEGKAVDVSVSLIICGYEQTIKNLANTYYPWSFYLNEENKLCSLFTIPIYRRCSFLRKSIVFITRIPSLTTRSTECFVLGSQVFVALLTAPYYSTELWDIPYRITKRLQKLKSFLAMTLLNVTSTLGRSLNAVKSRNFNKYLTLFLT